MYRFLLSRSLATAAGKNAAAPKATGTAAGAVKKAAKPAATTSTQPNGKHSAAPNGKHSKTTKAAAPAQAKKVDAAADKKTTAKPKAEAEETRTKMLSPYAAFMRDYFAKNKPANPLVNFAEISKTCSKQWKSLSPEAQQKFAGQAVKVKHNRRETALDLFKRMRMKELAGNPDALTTVAREWKSMSETDKAKYAPEEKLSKERSDRKKSAWQIFLSNYFEKNKDRKGDEKFQDVVKRAAAEFKSLSSAEKGKLEQKA